MTGLTDVELRELIVHSALLPFRAGLRGARRSTPLRIGQRELVSVRVWLSRASTRQLNEVAKDTSGLARWRLRRCGGFSEEACAEPELEDLEAMAGFLHPVIARLMLHALLSDSGSAAGLVSQHWERLLEAAIRPGEAYRCQRGEVCCQDLDAGGERIVRLVDLDEREESVPDDDFPVSELAESAQSMRERSDIVANRLDEAAGFVRSGFGLPGDVLEDVGMWVTERTTLAERIASAGGAWYADEGFTRLDAVVEALRSEAEAGALARENLSGLERRREELLEFIERAEQQGGGMYIDGLRNVLRELELEIGTLRGDTGPSQPVAEPLTEDPPAESRQSMARSTRADGTIEVLPEEGSAPRTAATADNGPLTAPPTADPPALAEVPSRPLAVENSSEVSESGANTGFVVAPIHLGDYGVEPEDEAIVQETSCLPWQTIAADITGADVRSPVERLVDASRFQEAYWLTLASDEPVHRAECLAFADAAFSCDLAEEAALVMTRFGPDPETLRGDRPALVMATVASLRAGLVAGWPNDLLLQTDAASSVPDKWARVLKSAVDVLRRYQHFDPKVIQPQGDEPVLSKAAIARAADELHQSLTSKKTPYARATQVQKRLVVADQPLGRALDSIRAWATGSAEASILDEAWATFRKRDAPDRIIEEADAAIRTPRQAKEPIEAKAKRALLHRIDEVITLLSQARALTAPETEELGDAATALRYAVDQVDLDGDDTTSDLSGPEIASLRRLHVWLRGEHSESVPRRVLDIVDTDAGPDKIEPGAESLLAALDLPRSRDGLPQPEEPGFTDAVVALLEGVDIRSVLVGYSGRGDLHLAERLVEALEQNLVPAAPFSVGDIPGDWRTLRSADWDHWSRKHREAHHRATGLLADLRTQGLDDRSERELVGQLEYLTQPSPEGAFRTVLNDIHEFVQGLDTRLDAHLERLRERLKALAASEQDSKRITELLDAGDTVTAEECLALLRKGSSLPDWSGVNWGEELEQFMVHLEADTPAKPGRHGHSAAPWAERYGGGQPLTEGSRIGLESWDALCVPSTRGSEWQRHVPSVLRVLGLEGRPPTLGKPHPMRGVLRLTAKLAVSEAAPGYVAALGSAATTYTVLVVADELRGRSPLQLLRNESDACVILYLYPLGLAGRRTMAEHAKASQQALVVDPAVFGWIAARSPRSFRAAQRVTLPWTAFAPYTPFVAGLVPPEVFYGRHEEMATVVDPLGALFLYGGRQLGKSALLRKVEADFAATPDRKAVYLDLKARGVGETEPASRIWSVLSDELKRVGVIGAKVSAGASADDLVTHVRRWLEDDRERRVLVLADEADKFLMADSKAVHGGDGIFANVARLKGLMDATQRRFKIVFAGLHQVQRFSHLSNVPLAHGAEMRIGPLKPSEAQRLVVEPMAAFGYHFERPSLVWRVLAATNYQACLVQIFCGRLVAAMREKPLGAARWPITVTEEDVRAVAESVPVHRNIAERLRITINLEDRYRVLALVISLRSHTDRFQLGYDADDLLSEAKRHWHDGFDKLTANDVKIYLDEMVGLGLLVETDRNRYAVRSPNVVRMLGTHEDLELELRQTEFSLPYDYNPRFSRRLVGIDSHDIAHYSPLTEQQLYEATSQGVSVVCMTKAYGPDLVTIAIKSYAEARGLAVCTVSAHDMARTLKQEMHGKQPSVVIAELRMCGAQPLRECVEMLQVHTSRESGGPPRAAVIIVDPMTWQDFDDEQVTRVLRPERWNTASLHAWPECPFDTSDKRRRLADATGGWPNVVERTIHLATHGGATLETALEEVAGHFANPDRAADHLSRVELDHAVIERLSAWTQYVEPGEGCSYADIAAVTGMELEEVRRLMNKLTDHGVLDDGEGGYALDPVTFRSLVVVRLSEQV